jgi:endonuclease YncB( thermonuclease family)
MSRTLSLILASLLALATPTCASDLVGRASVVDGDTIEIHDTRIRLFGIDAPESAQTCRDAADKEYRCGQVAANELADHLDGKTVACIPRELDRYGRTVALCMVSDADIGDWLVRRGLAVDFTYYSKGKYRLAQDEASLARAGMWAGRFVEPRYFRSCMKNGKLPSFCSSN